MLSSKFCLPEHCPWGLMWVSQATLLGVFTYSRYFQHPGFQILSPHVLAVWPQEAARPLWASVSSSIKWGNNPDMCYGAASLLHTLSNVGFGLPFPLLLHLPHPWYPSQLITEQLLWPPMHAFTPLSSHKTPKLVIPIIMWIMGCSLKRRTTQDSPGTFLNRNHVADELHNPLDESILHSDDNRLPSLHKRMGS